MSADNATGWRFFGIPRSGNHAVIEWFLKNIGEEDAIFFNNCLEGDPFTKFSYCTFFHDGHLRKHRANIYRKRNKHFDALLTKAKTAKALVLSYEIMQIDDASRARLWDSAKMSVPLQSDFFVLRSPLNLVASLIKRIRKEIDNPEKRRAQIATWVETLAADYAAYLEMHARSPHLVVIYDRWGADKEYRAKILRENGLKAEDLSLGDMTSAGGGSSFDTDQKIESISTSKRWPHFVGDEDFRIIINTFWVNPIVQKYLEHVFPQDFAEMKNLAESV